MSDNQHTVALADLSASKVREENPQVAELIESKEERIDELQDEKADLKMEIRTKDEKLEEIQAYKEDKEEEAEEVREEVREEFEAQIEELEEELEAKNEIIEGIRENERAEMLEDLRQARARINGVEPDEIDLSNLEEASTDEIRPALDVAEEAAERVEEAQSTASASSSREQVGGSTASNTDTDEERKMQIAEDMGVADLMKKAEDMSPEGFTVPANQGGD